MNRLSCWHCPLFPLLSLVPASGYPSSALSLAHPPSSLSLCLRSVPLFYLDSDLLLLVLWAPARKPLSPGTCSS